MSGVGVIVSDPLLQSQLTQVELRSLNTKFAALKNQSDKVTLEDLPPVLARVKSLTSAFKEKEIRETLPDDLDFESFLRVYLILRDKAADKSGGLKHSASFLKAS
ncbi:unnamed protein product [Eruca vesicaria subsp. sativa]|uniref:Uncharacterized protein n=1 Tax=Eruca vesicaria subsp. sativa TaxID=29727 RepID=A0ABC8JI80_ERUVS|nr:unnamed protein product [Eruca vesicaria subsp. sativa]